MEKSVDCGSSGDGEACLQVGDGDLTLSFCWLQFTLGRQVPLSDAAIVHLQKWGAGRFGQLEEVFRGFQFSRQHARWINHMMPASQDIQHRVAAEEKRPLWGNVSFDLGVAQKPLSA